MEMCPWRTDSDLGQASSDGTITSGHQSTAGLAQLVLGDLHAIARSAAVGIHGKSVITDPAYFGTEVAHAHFASLALGQRLTFLQGLEHTIRLGFGVDHLHSIFLSVDTATQQRSMIIAKAGFAVKHVCHHFVYFEHVLQYIWLCAVICLITDHSK